MKLFPTQIHFAPLKLGARLHEQIHQECYGFRDLDSSGARWSRKNYLFGYTSYGSINKVHRLSSTFMELERLLNRHVRSYARSLEWDLGGRSLAMTDCWINIMPFGVTHGLHLHPNSVVSGTYYVRTPRGCPGLKFEDPRLSRFMASPPRRADASAASLLHVTYPAKAGHLTLFESWLRHEVPSNPLKSERISISFNYNWF